ncbi:MAG: MBL fold metallo-hydrolase [Burkholderiales bacterium]
MKVRFWGVRGSIPVPGESTRRYGGNTTCIEIRTDADNLIVLDAGTGIYQLAQSLLKELPVHANLFITHTHWDHIQGLPFFLPIFIPGCSVQIRGAHDIVAGTGIERVMDVQMQYSYFPVREAELKASITYEDVQPGLPVTIGDATVTPVLLNHPVVNFGYRVECNGKSVFFTGDHERHHNIYQPGEDGFAAYQQLVELRTVEVAAAIGPVDLLIADCSYTAEEYATKIGWGHGSYDSSIEMAQSAGAKRLACTHHEPTRHDDELERVFAETMQRIGTTHGLQDIFLAREGVEITL